MPHPVLFFFKIKLKKNECMTKQSCCFFFVFLCMWDTRKKKKQNTSLLLGLHTIDFQTCQAVKFPSGEWNIYKLLGFRGVHEHQWQFNTDRGKVIPPINPPTSLPDEPFHVGSDTAPPEPPSLATGTQETRLLFNWCILILQFFFNYCYLLLDIRI